MSSTVIWRLALTNGEHGEWWVDKGGIVSRALWCMVDIIVFVMWQNIIIEITNGYIRRHGSLVYLDYSKLCATFTPVNTKINSNLNYLYTYTRCIR